MELPLRTLHDNDTALLPLLQVLNQASNVCAGAWKCGSRVNHSGLPSPLKKLPGLNPEDGRYGSRLAGRSFLGCSTVPSAWCLVLAARHAFLFRLVSAPCSHPVLRSSRSVPGSLPSQLQKKFDVGFRISNFDFCKGQASEVASPIPLSPVLLSDDFNIPTSHSPVLHHRPPAPRLRPVGPHTHFSFSGPPAALPGICRRSWSQKAWR
ncbi:uncharacterized protein B0H64DRAFT_75991 [Chaetomium fimeti]|uniref:Uncharacterized protein n=1 Tax=Chaetomium fimeti TaxID=1854472 RepID=A0AAE0HLM5_9PEZI|nr:hypothetical protein B0H64DRAFT_75991 [Chaetomium fimeti]